MGIDEYCLSIWEIAHRWNQQDPDRSDPKNLSFDVQDSLRNLTKSLVRERFHVYNQNGVRYDLPSDLVKVSDYIPHQLMKVTEEIDMEGESYCEKRLIFECMSFKEAGIEEGSIDIEDEYWAYYETRTRRFSEAVSDLDRCYKERIYEKKKLESIFLSKSEIYKYAKEEGLPTPKFWLSDSDIKEFISAEKLSDPVKIFRGVHEGRDIDRDLCRAIAVTFWEMDGDLTQAFIRDHPITRKYGNAALYKDPQTVTSWIADLDPRPKDKRRGRPKKKNVK
jgi:hypothetical protein